MRPTYAGAYRDHSATRIWYSAFLLGPKEIDLGYADRFTSESEIHHALAALRTVDIVTLKEGGGRVVISNLSGAILGGLSKSAAEHWAGRVSMIREAKVFAVIKRRADQDENEERRSRCRVAEWEVPLLELKITA